MPGRELLVTRKSVWIEISWQLARLRSRSSWTAIARLSHHPQPRARILVRCFGGTGGSWSQAEQGGEAELPRSSVSHLSHSTPLSGLLLPRPAPLTSLAEYPS